MTRARRTRKATTRHAYDPLLNRKALARICTLPERDVPAAYGIPTFKIDEPMNQRFDWYAFQDNGASVLAVAHLDVVGKDRRASITDTSAGPVIHSRALDDRLGAYVILDLLPKLGVEVDILFTTGEENGCSTAEFFDGPRQYDHIVEFDRGANYGMDVVTYGYGSDIWDDALEEFFTIGRGSFSDISYLEHLGAKAVNVGVGYTDEHTSRCMAYLHDTFDMLQRYVAFNEQWDGIAFPHVPRPATPFVPASAPPGYLPVTSTGWVWPSSDRDMELEEDSVFAEHRHLLEMTDKEFTAWMTTHA